MFFFSRLLCVLALVGATAPAFSSPNKPIITNNPKLIQWIEYNDIYDLRVVCKKVSGADSLTMSHMVGCFEPKENLCIVHTMTPVTINDTWVHQILGHEIRHCFKGFYHK